ncbi:2,3-diphosphoglycerate-dependent phosphoglycerate mutase [Candidatus Riesia pediculicola]|uniref:2,3-bisphosphoglycerate-dependent phosphoglycerate mutase n=1 Tax=Riesia pediculicola (strain USDA) TaxID=515618 RepID=D4G840_RIEPU|nr:2,3-diphosphoglycerate-dependent phosphoglycerate mutase [Candidatus Riesia pediculicola]ADD79583.1 2,3-bisphosphoglycerate-dependent phosphoglycerate mutase [Candidatus Riesia pediculicola USDA]QOJ86385.1 2,3-diphosphoglycerate-dependent phosphoglycerate mutase [Candidatus Riesia pediculicola]
MFVRLVIIRHGTSIWNQLNKFTGWTDVPLSKEGYIEAKKAGKILKKNRITFDVAYTSFLKRAIHTLWEVLKEIDKSWIPVYKTWNLNERHYGALQGLNKEEVSKEYGKDQVELWRRSFKIKPPSLKENSVFMKDVRYNTIIKKNFPDSESLEDTLKRVVPLWKEEIKPKIKRKNKVLIVAHGNSLRALAKHLENISEESISKLNIPTAKPIVYEFDRNIDVINRYYL